MISVVIPSYNSSKFLAATVQSVLAQTFTAWELIIVDDGSQDDSIAIAEELQAQDSRISIFSQKNAGASAARNHGLTEANSAYPYALCLDSDDLLLPNALQTLLTLLESHPNAPAVCGFLQDIDSAGQFVSYHRADELTQRRGVVGFRLVPRAPDAAVAFGDLCFRNHIITPGQVLIRKIALETVGVFDQSLVYIEDYDLWWRLTMQIGPIPVTLEPVLLYRHHGTSISRNRQAVKKGQTDWRWRLLTYPRMSPEQRRTGRIGHFYHCLASWGGALFVLRRGAGDLKYGFELIYNAFRDLLLFVRDLYRVRKETKDSSPSVSQ